MIEFSYEFVLKETPFIGGYTFSIKVDPKDILKYKILGTYDEQIKEIIETKLHKIKHLPVVRESK